MHAILTVLAISIIITLLNNPTVIVIERDKE